MYFSPLPPLATVSLCGVAGIAVTFLHLSLSAAPSSLVFHAFRSLQTVSFHSNIGLPLAIELTIYMLQICSSVAFSTSLLDQFLSLKRLPYILGFRRIWAKVSGDRFDSRNDGEHFCQRLGKMPSLPRLCSLQRMYLTSSLSLKCL